MPAMKPTMVSMMPKNDWNFSMMFDMSKIWKSSMPWWRSASSALAMRLTMSLCCCVVGLDLQLRRRLGLLIDLVHRLERHGDEVEPVEVEVHAQVIELARLRDDAAADAVELERVTHGIAVPHLLRDLGADDADLGVARVLLGREEAPLVELAGA